MVATCSAAAAQYGSPGLLAQHPCGSSALPLTGIDLIWIALFALGLLSLGIGLYLKVQAER